MSNAAKTTTAHHPRRSARFALLACGLALAFTAACGTDSGNVGQEAAAELASDVSQSPADLADQEDDERAATGDNGTPTANPGDIEIVGPDPECPFISTDAVIEATGITGLTTASFGPNTNTQGEYICEWTSSLTGPAVHMLVLNGGGGWTAEAMDNPNWWGEAPGRDYLVESIGPMGGFLEVWTSEKRTSNYVYGDQIYTARGPYTIDDSLNPFAQFIIGWYGTSDPSEFDDIARALLEQTDATFIPSR